MEIEVGEWVRTENGIDKFLYKTKYDNGVNKYVFEKTEMSNPEYYVLKHSKNIIDLIQEGDYVNGYKVLDKDFKNEMICLLMPFNEENESKYNIVWNSKYFIKSIVTHEQFSSVEYLLEEE